MPIGVDPDSDKRPLLPEGEYGFGGEATLLAIVARPVPGDRNEGLYYMDLNVQVDDAEQGRVFLHTTPFGAHNTQLGKGAGSIAKVLLASLGLPADTQFEDAPDEKGNHQLQGPSPAGSKVVVGVAVEKYKKNGVEQSQNVVKSIALRV